MKEFFFFLKVIFPFVELNLSSSFGMHLELTNEFPKKENSFHILPILYINNIDK